MTLTAATNKIIQGEDRIQSKDGRIWCRDIEVILIGQLCGPEITNKFKATTEYLRVQDPEVRQTQLTTIRQLQTSPTVIRMEPPKPRPQPKKAKEPRKETQQDKTLLDLTLNKTDRKDIEKAEQLDKEKKRQYNQKEGHKAPIPKPKPIPKAKQAPKPKQGWKPSPNKTKTLSSTATPTRPRPTAIKITTERLPPEMTPLPPTPTTPTDIELPPSPVSPMTGVVLPTTTPVTLPTTPTIQEQLISHLRQMYGNLHVHY